MASLDLYDAEQPMDPMLVKAIETAFLSFSVPTVQFMPVPQAWRKSNPAGGSKGPKGARKAAIKLELAQRDGFRCAYCARAFVDLDDATLDHVIPNCVVGHWQPWNLVLACGPCNNAKGDGVPLVLMPLLCHLLIAAAPAAKVIAEAKRNRHAKLVRANRVRRQKERARKRYDRYQAAIEAMAGRRVHLAIEASPVHAALPEGGRA